MFSSSYKLCYEAIPKLKNNELRKLRAWIDGTLALRGESIASTTSTSSLDEQDWLARAFGKLMVKQGQISPDQLYLEIAAQKRKVPDFDKKSQKVRTWLARHIDNLESVPVQDHVGNLIAITLKNNLRWMTSGVSLLTLFERIEEVPKAVEAELPGYVENGLLSKLAQPPRRGE